MSDPGHLGVDMKHVRIILIVALSVCALGIATSSGPSGAATHKLKKPGRPTGVVVAPLNGALGVQWSAPASDGGSAIVRYTVTVIPGEETCATTGATVCAVTGLTNGMRYSASVDASNAIGTGLSSRRVRQKPSSAPDCAYLGPDADAAGCSLAGTSLVGANLYHADLAGADLARADLSGADAAGANLTGADLDGADFDPCPPGTPTNLTGATLTDASVVGTDFTCAILTGAVLAGVNLSSATLTGVVSGGITGTGYTLPTNWSLISGYLVGPQADLNGADLSGDTIGADMAGAILTGANFSYADVDGSDFENADLDGANFWEADVDSDFTNANLDDTDFAGTTYLDDSNLTDASFDSADLSDAILFDTNLSGTDLGSATLTGVWSGGITGSPASLPAQWVLVDGYLIGPDAQVPEANLAGAQLSASFLDNANLNGTNLDGTNLREADMTDADLQGTNFTGANLDDADLAGATFAFDTWSNTICPDGKNSNSVGDTCVNDLKVTDTGSYSVCVNAQDAEVPDGPWTFTITNAKSAVVATVPVALGSCSAIVNIPGGVFTVTESIGAPYEVGAETVGGPYLLSQDLSTSSQTLYMPANLGFQSTFVDGTIGQPPSGQFEICTEETSPDANLVGQSFPFTWSYTVNGTLVSGSVTNVTPSFPGSSCSTESAWIPTTNSNGTPVEISVTAEAPVVSDVAVDGIGDQGLGSEVNVPGLPALFPATATFDLGGGPNQLTFTDGRTA